MSHYARLYSGDGQSGGSFADIVVYEGPSQHHQHHQVGAGLGNYFSRAFRLLRPFISSGVNALKNQGIVSSRAVLSQLGKKNLKEILKEEGQKALKDLGDKALSKLSHASGKVANNSTSIQSGSGATAPSTVMPLGLSPLQLQRYHRKRRQSLPIAAAAAAAATIGGDNPTPKTIKRKKMVKRVHTARRRRVGGIGVKSRARKRQVGGGRRKRKTRCVKNRRRKTKTTKRRRRTTQSKKQLDIFN